MLLSINLPLRRCRLNDVSLGLRCHSWRSQRNWWGTNKRIIWVGCCSTIRRTNTSMGMHMLRHRFTRIRGASSNLIGGM